MILGKQNIYKLIYFLILVLIGHDLQYEGQYCFQY